MVMLNTDVLPFVVTSLIQSMENPRIAVPPLQNQIDFQALSSAQLLRMDKLVRVVKTATPVNTDGHAFATACERLCRLEIVRRWRILNGPVPALLCRQAN